MGKWTESASGLIVALILVLAVAGSVGCGPKKTAPAPVDPTPAADAEPVAETEATAEAEPADGGEPPAEIPMETPAEREATLSDEEVSALFQEAKNLYQLGQEIVLRAQQSGD